MHFAIIDIVKMSSPLMLIATLRGIWKEGRSRSVMLRMLPPERRPGRHKPEPSQAGRACDTQGDHKRQARPLWTLRDCQMELLTDGVMHAFEASAATYKPDRVASNYPPGRVSRRIALERARAESTDRASILVRSLERTADMLSAGGVAISRGKPQIEDSSPDTLTYLGLAQPAHNQGAA